MTEPDIPDWLTVARPTLISKNKESHVVKNYRPTECPNIMYKIYTGCQSMFLQDHCQTNCVILVEQAGGKKEERGLGLY